MGLSGSHQGSLSHTCTLGFGPTIWTGEFTSSYSPNDVLLCKPHHSSPFSEQNWETPNLMSFHCQELYITYACCTMCTHTHTLARTYTHNTYCRVTEVNGIYCYCDNLGVEQNVNVADIRLF